MGKERLRIDLIKDHLVRRALGGATVTFAPEDPSPNSGIGSRIPVDRKQRTGVKLGDAAFHPAFGASSYIVRSRAKGPDTRGGSIDNLTREDMAPK